jgi:Tfp pilus assembly protein PilF
MGENSPNHSGHRLDSWKEIACFFGRDERTVRRWEKESGLPVHRVPGSGKARVFAYEDELSQWLHRSKSNGNPEPALITATAPAATEDPVSVSPVVPTENSSALHTLAKTAFVLSLCAGLVIGVFFYRKSPGFAVDASARTLVPREHTPDPEAKELYLKGRYYWNKRTPDGLNKAVDYFTQAVVHDPSFAPGYAGLADCYNLLREYALMPEAEAYRRSLASAKRAVELDDQSSEARASLAFALFYGSWDVAGADREFRRAIQLDPNNAVAHHWYATFLLTMRRFPESLTEIERAQTLDPGSRSVLADKGLVLLMAGQRDEGLALLRQIETNEPDFRSPHVYLRDNYLNSADYASFLDEAEKDASTLHDDVELAVTAAAEQGYAEGGAQGLLVNMLQEQEKLYREGRVGPMALARTNALLGKRQETLRYLNTAFERHDPSLLFIENSAEFNGLHDDPSYRDLIARLKLPPQE